MKSYKQFRGEIYQESAFGDFFRFGAGGKTPGIFTQMVGKLISPSISSAPVIDTRSTTARKAGMGIYLRHKTDPNNRVKFAGKNAQQKADDYARKNPDYVYENVVLTAAQKLALMGDDRRADTLAALNRLKKVGDVNRLSNRHRTLVTKFLTKTGGLDRVSGAVARQTLSMYKKMGTREDV